MIDAAPIEILVVEDAEAHAELIARVFEPAGDRFRLRVATDLREARAAIAARLPDLVIADNRLPDGRGLELAVPGGDYPLVMMTSHGDETAAVEAMKAGALDYVVKRVEVLLDLPHLAERALREWGHILERRRTEAELRQRELELRHAQKLEAIGRLASGVAHDFNNVLMGIAGCVDVAVSKLAADHPARAHLEDVRGAARRATSITARLLAFSRRGELARAPVDIDELIRQVAVVIRGLLPADIALGVVLDAEDARVEGDAGQLEQVLLNLAANARDAMPGGGALRLATRTRRTDDGAQVIELTVADTGVGMDEATRTRVFEPFFTTKEVGRGTGLGLATIYGIVAQHGGRIEVDSAPGAGTTFRVELPCAADERADPPPAPEVPAAAPAARARLVLLVEDEPLVRATVHHYLTEGGHEVLEAADAERAAALLREHGERVELVVTDVVLPGGGGARVAELSRAVRPDAPIVFMSAHPAEVLAAEGRLPPGEVVLQKPFARADLLAAIERAAPPSVLLVENERLTLDAVTQLLTGAGFAVVGVARAADALASSAARRFDVVVTDLGLPDLPGDELAARLGAERPGLPVLFVTGRAKGDPALVRALAAPLTAVAYKPVDIDAMVAQLWSLLAAAKAAPPPGPSLVPAAAHGAITDAR